MREKVTDSLSKVCKWIVPTELVDTKLTGMRAAEAYCALAFWDGITVYSTYYAVFNAIAKPIEEPNLIPYFVLPFGLITTIIGRTFYKMRL